MNKIYNLIILFFLFLSGCSNNISVKSDMGFALNRTIEEIRKHTERKIVIKRKGEGDFKQTLEKAHVIVSFGSVADVEALIRGVPVIGSPYSPAIPVSNNIKDIENLTYFDRTAWLSSLAASEWHKNEMDKCWDRLKGQLDGIY